MIWWEPIGRWGESMNAVLMAAAGIGVAPAQASRYRATRQHSRPTALLARVNVAVSEFDFVLRAKVASAVSSASATNAGKIKHDFEIDGRKTRLLATGQSTTATGMKGVCTIT